MKYRDEFRIASTAILLSVAMFGISVVVPKESRVPTAKTTLVEAPETAAEAEAAAEQTEVSPPEASPPEVSPEPSPVSSEG